MPKHAYMSAVVYVRPYGSSRTIVKAHTWCAFDGWLGDRVFLEVPMTNQTPDDIFQARIEVRDGSVDTASRVHQRTLRQFGILANYAAVLHGEYYPTWIGDFYVTPSIVMRGAARISRFLIEEAPGLDCGTWEEDSVPVSDG